MTAEDLLDLARVLRAGARAHPRPVLDSNPAAAMVAGMLGAMAVEARVRAESMRAFDAAQEAGEYPEDVHVAEAREPAGHVTVESDSDAGLARLAALRLTGKPVPTDDPAVARALADARVVAQAYIQFTNPAYRL